MWLPFDDRLAWLYAELLNVQGDAEGAYRLMDDLISNRGWSNVEQLKRHKQILKRAVEARQALTPDLYAQLSWSLGRTQSGTGLAGAAPEVAWAAANYLAQPRSEAAQRVAADTPTGRRPPRSIFPDGRDLAIGFGTGVLVTLLVVLQGRQWLRPRQRTPAHEPAGERGVSTP
jgi:hypothetical protein